MSGNVLSFVVLFTVALVLTVMVIGLFKRTLRQLLDEVIRIPPATVFYLRMFVVCIVFIALSAVLQTKFDLEQGKPFMEFVWKIASGLSEYFKDISTFLAFYLFFITILIVVLKRNNKNDK